MPVPPSSALRPTTVEITAHYVHLARDSVRESALRTAASIEADMLSTYAPIDWGDRNSLSECVSRLLRIILIVNVAHD